MTVESPHSPVTKHESLGDLQSHGSRQPLKRPYTPPHGLPAHPVKSFNDLNLSDSDIDMNRKEIVQRTKNIAAVAARKRTHQKVTVDRFSRPEKLNLHERSFASMRAVNEADEVPVTHSRLSHVNRAHYVASPVGTHLSDIDDLSSVRSFDTRSHGPESRIGPSRKSQVSKFPKNSVADRRQTLDTISQVRNFNFCILEIFLSLKYGFLSSPPEMRGD